MNDLISNFLAMQSKCFMLFGCKSYPGCAGYSIVSRVKGRLGYFNAIDYMAMHWQIPRKKVWWIFYESNGAFRKRVVEEIRNIHRRAVPEAGRPLFDTMMDVQDLTREVFH